MVIFSSIFVWRPHSWDLSKRDGLGITLICKEHRNRHAHSGTNRIILCSTYPVSQSCRANHVMQIVFGAEEEGMEPSHRPGKHASLIPVVVFCCR